MVLCHHIKHHPDSSPHLTLGFIATIPFDFGYLGVSLFLVVSGFCIHLSAARSMARGEMPHSSWGAFWRRRFHRLYPPYVVIVAVMVLMLALRGTVPAAKDVLLHIFLLHNLFGLAIGFGLGNPPLWSLGLEEQLYGLYAIYRRLRSTYRYSVLLVLAGSVTALWVFGVNAPLWLRKGGGRRKRLAGHYGRFSSGLSGY